MAFRSDFVVAIIHYGCIGNDIRPGDDDGDRYHNHLGLVLNVSSVAGEDLTSRASGLLHRGGVHYSWKMRGYYVIPMALWLFGPLWLALGMVLRAAALASSQSFSGVRCSRLVRVWPKLRGVERKCRRPSLGEVGDGWSSQRSRPTAISVDRSSITMIRNRDHAAPK